MAKSKQFSPILDIPLLYRNTNSLSAKVNKSAKKLNDMELELRLAELFRYYGLPMPASKIPTNTLKLIIAMARDLKIPGFFYKHEIKRPGRPAKWMDKEGLVLLLQTEIVTAQNPDKALRSVLNIVKQKYNYAYSLNSLYTRYSEASKSHSGSRLLKWHHNLKEKSKLSAEEYVDILNHTLSGIS